MNTVTEPTAGASARRAAPARPRHPRSAAGYPPGAVHAQIDSPIGKLDLVVDDAGRLLRIAFASDEEAFGHLPHAPDRFAAITGQLTQYFAGTRQRFDLALAPQGTPFQQRVWQGLLTIPFGETLSYGQLAARLGDGAHARAVGTANGRNPIPIVIPCHRVIGADGSLTGYGGGLERKRQLLALEGAHWRE
jgi:methylated-DNA-[protein]-cysteine S-methyltransferase